MPSDSVGDEFYIILVDSTPQIAAQLPERIEKRLQHIAPQKEIGFSSGIYAMKENDTLHDAYKASDERLYVNKQNKKQPFMITFCGCLLVISGA